MSKLLYIKANPKSDEDSRTFLISNAFISAYQKQNPNDEIVILDLYKENIQPLDAESVSAHKSSATSDENNEVLKYAYQFITADKYVFAEPLWNLGIPSILKSYIDYICMVGITFKYTLQGVVGLCEGKKALNITTRGGGSYSEGYLAQIEHGDKYLRDICKFMGVCNFTTIAAEKLDIQGSDTTSILEQATKNAEEIAKTF